MSLDLRRRLSTRFDAAVAPDASPERRLVTVRGRSRSALTDRIQQVVSAVAGHTSGDGLVAATGDLARCLAGGDPQVAWLTLAVVRAELPSDQDVTAFLRAVRLYGIEAVVGELLAIRDALASGRRTNVTIVSGEVIVDLDHTSRTDLATGIQRVARETASRWDRDHEIVVVGWTDGFTALRRLDTTERARALGQQRPTPPSGDAGVDIVVPWRSTVLLPELAAEPVRTERLLSLAKHSTNRTGLIGFDCVPITTAETSADGMGGAFAHLLAAARHMDRIVAISEAAGEEHRGWRAMLHSAGLAGPEIDVVSLPVDRRTPTPAEVETARERFALGRLPIVLCVGSHEPRKNHLAVLHAAELLWRQGREFLLLFVGGNSWKSEGFTARLNELRGAGRPVETVSGLDDSLLWALYTLARVLVFPSLNEGYGLPVAEALAGGTPAVTSSYGSMAEIAAGGGAVVVDPRDDDDIAAGIDRLLVDHELHARLVAEALARPTRTWDDYARETWQMLAGSDDRVDSKASPA